MFTRLGTIAVRHRRAVLTLTVVFIALAGVLGGAVFDRLSGGGFEDPGSESAQAEQYVEETFGAASPNVVLLVTAESGDVDTPDTADAGKGLTADLGRLPTVDQALSYWTLDNAPPLRSTTGDATLVLGVIAGDDDAVTDAVGEIVDEFAGDRGPVTVEVGGRAEVFRQVGETIEGDLARAESIAIPLTLALLIAVFGSLVAALLPVGIGVVAVFGAFLVLWLVTGVTDVSVFSINLVTALGLGLAIDYSLFVVSRYREELAAGVDVEAAVRRTVETAGRTVVFSALTVAVSLSALLIFPLFFLRSFAYAGIGVILVAMVTSVLSLPALLATLGHRVDRGRLRPPRPPTPVGEGIWHRIAVGVMRRPLLVTIAVVTLLVGLGLPFLGVRFASPDHRALPEGNPARVVSEALVDDFDSAEANAFPVVITETIDDATLDAFAADVSARPDVTRVDARTGRFADGVRLVGPDRTSTQFEADGGTRLSVVPAGEPASTEGEDLTRALRTSDPGFALLVGGAAAQQLDVKAAIFELVPWAAAWIAGATFVLLFLMFGSVLVPVKALILNTLSLTATFGAMVWVFQHGNGAGLLDFTPTGLTDTTTPILMFCIAFGLSMDYEVFLLSRIKEEHDRGADNDTAVAVGLERTGRIVTAAAMLLAVTFLAFATSGVTFIKLFGLGLALAVLMDAFVVRSTLVPAVMKLAGEANWWAPAPLRRLHDRFGLREAPAVPPTRPEPTPRGTPEPTPEMQPAGAAPHDGEDKHRDPVGVG